MFNAFGNATYVPPTNWRKEPATRGTWNILSSCLITLGLCLWTALHLNIPRHKEGIWRPKLRKIAWLLLGLLAPEMLAYTAWFQHRAAHKLNVVVRRSLGQRGDLTCCQKLAAFFARCCHCRKNKVVPHNETDAEDIELAQRHKKTHPPKADNQEGHSRNNLGIGRRHRWTTAHSYYALMGGFVFDTSDAEVNFLPNSRKRLTLTPAGLLYLLDNEPGLLPNISEEHIRDKSKASNLAKTLVCLQALWFCVQCLVRFGQHFAVSLLELNVFGHAICALLMYLLWWDKPLDIEEPTVLTGSMANEMCALMCMRSFPEENGFWSNEKMDLPELPYGVRYGSERRCNVAETSVRPVGDYPKWYTLKEIVGFLKIIIPAVLAFWQELLYDVLVILGREELRETPEPTILECRLDWAPSRAVDTQARAFSQYTSYPVDLEYPRDDLESKLQAGTSQPNPAGAATSPPIIPTNSQQRTNNVDLDGFCLTLGRWPLAKDNLYARDEDKHIIKATVFVPRQPQPDYTPVSVKLSHGDAIRWRFCSRALRRYYPQPRWFKVSGLPSHQNFPAHRSVYDRSPNWPSSQQLKFTKEGSDQPLLAIWLGFSFAGLVYGGLHLLAWDAPFPSHIGYKLWCASGILLAASGFIITLFIVTFAPLVWMIDSIARTKFWEGVKTYLGDRYKALANIGSKAGLFLGVVIFGIPCFAFAAAYLAARGYLVVESFIQLLHLPDSAYALPRWSQYFPHIT